MKTVDIHAQKTLFHPNSTPQANFLDDYTHRCLAFIGGWGSGKTWAGARKLVSLHIANSATNKGSPTGIKGLAIAPTYQLAMTVTVPEIRRALAEAELRYQFSADAHHFAFTLSDLGTRDNRSQILIRSAERPDRLAGFEVGHLWGDEAGRWPHDSADPMSDTMLQAEGRLRAPGARCLQAIYTFTPEGDSTRVYDRFDLNAPRNPALAVYRARTDDNPLMRDFANIQRRQLPPELAAQYLDGQTMSLRGASVYPTFDPTKHIDPTLTLSPDLPLHLSIDFNIDPGMHAILGQHFQNDQLLTAVHELHAPRMDVRRMLTSLHDLFDRQYAGFPFPALHIYGDATGQGKWAGTGESCWDIVREGLRLANIPHHLRVPRANPPISDRVNAFNCALHGIDGKVRYRLHPRCHRLIKDLQELKWTAGDMDKRDRALSHASDAEGYRVIQLMPIRRPTSFSRTATIGFSD